MRKELIQSFTAGMAAGAIVLLIIIFAAGWVVTQSSAEEQASEMAEKAVLKKLVPICLTQFQQDFAKDQKLKELQAEDSWKRGDYVKKQGWATMPGGELPEENIADACSTRILDLASKK